MACLVDNVALKFIIICLGTSILGLSLGLLHVSQGRYVHLLCEKYGLSAKKGEMYGILNVLYCFANVLSGLIITFGLGFFDAVTFFYVLTAFGVITVVFCYLFVRDIN